LVEPFFTQREAQNETAHRCDLKQAGYDLIIRSGHAAFMNRLRVSYPTAAAPANRSVHRPNIP
jgi:hypothetical protein